MTSCLSVLVKERWTQAVWMCQDSVYMSSEFWTTTGLTGLASGEVGTSATERGGRERGRLGENERERERENERDKLTHAKATVPQLVVEHFS